MAEIISLHGQDYPAEKTLIEEKIDESPWFILDSQEAGLELEHYIGNLFDNYELGNRELARLRICKNFSWPSGAVTLIIPNEEGQNSCYNPADMRSLLASLQPDVKSYLVIENNERVLLANILQQLIYLDYPITNLDVKLRKEYKDAVRVQMFMENIDSLADAADQALTGIRSIVIPANAENFDRLAEQKENSLTTYREIGEQLKKAKNVEMKVAFAASKKTGKSVLVNCLLGQELAPTSLEMATPNTCVYKLSPDSSYHLHWLNETGEIIPGESKAFASAGELYREVNTKFKEAQKDQAGKFAINDLIIEYPQENTRRFSSYTIFDTPGPDAAGTAHRVSAERAIAECDASVFALDYSKYLTDTEEAYLKSVKDTFDKKGKFHTLLFTLNKVDLALGDDGAKSRVKTIDFIRNRLHAINEKYRDCVIFATSAQDYFYTLRLEEAAKKDDRLQPLLEEDTDWRSNFWRATKQVKKDSDDKLRTALSNLEAETIKIGDQLDYDPINLNVMRSFSGMPQMMSYLEYVLSSKAREEIVNNIAHTIDLQASKIKSLIGERKNLLILLQENDSKIGKISLILLEYRRDIDRILAGDINLDEDFDSDAKNGFLAVLMSTLNSSSMSLDSLLPCVKDYLFDQRSTSKAGRDRIWNSYSEHLLARIMDLKRESSHVRKENLALQEEQVKEIIDIAFQTIIDEYVEIVKKYIESWSHDLTSILSARFDRLSEVSAQCRMKLAKENVHLDLPELPQFDAALPTASISTFTLTSIDLTSTLAARFSDAVIKRSFHENIRDHGLFFWKYKSTQTLDGTADLSTLSEADIQQKINETRHEFIGMLTDNDFDEQLEAAQKEVVNNANAVQIQIKDAFKHQIDLCKQTIDNFCAVIDDREKYRHDSALTQLLLDTLESIKKESASFLEIWNEIANADGPISSNCEVKS